MPLTRSDNPYALLPGIKALFFQTLADAFGNEDWMKITTVVESNKDQEKYAWLGNVPKMREFTGERTLNALTETGYAIINKLWEDTLAIDRTDLEDDQYGQIRIRIQQLAQEVNRHKSELMFTLLANGFTQLCFDGQYFFDTDHTTPGAQYQTNQSNKGTTALSAASLATAIIAMAKFVDDRGRPLGIVADTLVVPPDLEWTARGILQSQYWPDATGTSNYQILTTNVMQGRLDLVVSPYLTDTNDWFLLCAKGLVKPLLLQDRAPVEFQSLEGNSESGFMRDQYLYGVRARYNAGYGLWQYAYGASV